MALSIVSNEVDQLRWDLIESQLPEGNRLTVRTAMNWRRGDILIAVDSTSRRHVLIEIPNGEPSEVSERTSRGIALQTVEMRIDSGQYLNFIDVVCLESNGHSVLDIVVLEIADALDAGASIHRISLVQNVLSKWRRFWSGIPQNLLSREQQLGLFGELWFLLFWLAPSVGFSVAVKSWRGPFGARNDFEKKKIGIEVKTCEKTQVRHTIHGLEQLLEPVDGALFLMSLSVREEGSDADCLPSIVRAIRSALVPDYDVLSYFDSGLYAAGYLDALEPEYAKLKLRVRVEELYRVTSGFPRLVPTSLCEPLMPGVGAINYELGLEGARPWRVATSSREATQLLSDLFEHK